MVYLLPVKEAGALPEWVTEVPEEADLEQLARTAFASPHERLFPLHSKTAAFLSALHAEASGVTDTAVLGRIKSACAAYNILDEVRLAHDSLPRETLPDSQDVRKQKTAHAIELVIEPGGEPEAFYPIDTVMQIEKSATDLNRDIGERKLPTSWFMEASRALVKAAGELGFPVHQIPPAVMALSVDRIPSDLFIQDQLEKRKEAGMPDAAVELCKEAYDSSCETGEYLEAAHLWEIADRKYAIDYSGGVLDPVKAFNSGMLRSQADEMAEEVFVLDDLLLPKTAFLTLPENTIAASFPRTKAAGLLQARSDGSANGITAAVDNLDAVQKTTLMQLLLLDQTA